MRKRMWMDLKIAQMEDKRNVLKMNFSVRVSM